MNGYWQITAGARGGQQWTNIRFRDKGRGGCAEILPVALCHRNQDNLINLPTLA